MDNQIMTARMSIGQKSRAEAHEIIALAIRETKDEKGSWPQLMTKLLEVYGRRKKESSITKLAPEVDGEGINVRYTVRLSRGFLFIKPEDFTRCIRVDKNPGMY